MSNNTKTFTFVGTPAFNPITGQATVYAIMQSLLAQDWSSDPNARGGYDNSNVQKGMCVTLREDPGHFPFYNNGVALTCREFVVHPDKDGGTIEAIMREKKDPNDSNGYDDGKIDGGSTVAGLERFLNALKEKVANHNTAPKERVETEQLLAKIYRNATIRVELIPGLTQSQIPKVSEARNSNNHVKAYSKANLIGATEPLKEALGATAKYVKWEENGEFKETKDERPTPTASLLMQIVSIFAAPHGQLLTKAYSGGGSVIADYAKNYKEDRYVAATAKVQDLMYLADDIAATLADEVKGLDPKDLKILGVKEEPYRLFWRDTILPVTIPTAMIFPILGALAILFNDTNTFVEEPRVFFKKHAKVLAERMVTQAQAAGVGSTHYGKLTSIWVSLREKVDLLLLKSKK